MAENKIQETNYPEIGKVYYNLETLDDASVILHLSGEPKEGYKLMDADKRPGQWFWIANDIADVKIESEILPTKTTEWFSNFSTIQNLDLKNLNTSNVTNMDRMFNSCTDLRNLDLSGFDTSKVTSMAEMFYNCYLLRNLDISNFDLKNVKNTCEIFYGCEYLNNLKTGKGAESLQAQLPIQNSNHWKPKSVNDTKNSHHKEVSNEEH